MNDNYDVNIEPISFPEWEPSNKRYTQLLMNDVLDFNYGETITHEDFNHYINKLFEYSRYNNTVLNNMLTSTDESETYRIPYIDKRLQDLEQQVVSDNTLIQGNNMGLNMALRFIANIEDGTTQVGDARHADSIYGIDWAGALKYYGTDANNNKGFHTFPSIIYVDAVTNPQGVSSELPLNLLSDINKKQFFPFTVANAVYVAGTNTTVLDALNDRYTKQEIDLKFTSLGAVMEFKGVVENETQLPLATADTLGDMYTVLHYQDSTIAHSVVSDGTAWIDMGEPLDLDDYYTKEQSDAKLTQTLNASVVTERNKTNTAISNAKSECNSYTDRLLNSSITGLHETVTQEISASLNAAKAYTNTQISNTVGNINTVLATLTTVEEE